MRERQREREREREKKNEREGGEMKEVNRDRKVERMWSGRINSGWLA